MNEFDGWYANVIRLIIRIKELHLIGGPCLGHARGYSPFWIMEARPITRARVAACGSVVWRVDVSVFYPHHPHGALAAHRGAREVQNYSVFFLFCWKLRTYWYQKIFKSSNKGNWIITLGMMT